MEQFRQIGEVLGSLNALMVLQDDILINQRQCCLLLDIFSLGFNTVAEEIRQNLKLEEKHTKWRALEQPLKELYRVFKEGETYVRSCMSNKDWWGKVINFHQNKDCVEFHIHNLFCYFPAVIEAIETAGEISGLDPSEMDRRRVVFSRKYDREWNDPKLFQWRFGKQYLIPKDICSRFENSWREDRWNLVEALQQKRKSKSDEIGKTEKRLADFLLKKLTGLEQFNGKLFPSSILVGSKDYQVRRRLGGGGQYKEIQWLGDSFVLRHFLGDLEPLDAEISSLLSLCHSNILQYLCGFYDEEKKECSLVMELMHKDLKSYMKENCGPRRRYLFSVPVVIDIMLQIARGMEYLHSNEIFHGDLNPMNILLKERSHTEGYFHAKISGFGLNSVKTFTRASSRPTTPAPVIWYAPEVLTEMEQDLKGITVPRSKFTHKADVYSFAMVCFELITGKVPFEDSHLQGDEMGKNIRRGDRPLFPFPSPKYLVSLIKRCWHSEPSQRPTFSSICRILRYVKKFLVVNPDQGHIQIQTPLVDCWDLEARFLKKFSIETGSHAESVMQIPFQLYSYRVAEKEKMSPNLNMNKEESSDTGGESASESVSDPPTTTPKYTKSLCLDAISEYSESDTRSLYSEAPKKKISPASKKSGDMAKLRRNSSAGLRSTGSSPVKPRPAPKVSLPLSPFGRNSKARKDTRLPLSPMSPMSPLGHTRRSRHLSGPASDSELT
uniref:Protein kinase domain-containing protein n=1 Tax=Brassica campestris TaxID=3711 RepID=M4EG32_BRACM